MPSTCFFPIACQRAKYKHIRFSTGRTQPFWRPVRSFTCHHKHVPHKGVDKMLKTFISDDVVSFVSSFLYPEALAVWGAQPFFSFLAFDSLWIFGKLNQLRISWHLLTESAPFSPCPLCPWFWVPSPPSPSPSLSPYPGKTVQSPWHALLATCVRTQDPFSLALAFSPFSFFSSQAGVQEKSWWKHFWKKRWHMKSEVPSSLSLSPFPSWPFSLSLRPSPWPFSPFFPFFLSSLFSPPGSIWETQVPVPRLHQVAICMASSGPSSHDFYFCYFDLISTPIGSRLHPKRTIIQASDDYADCDSCYPLDLGSAQPYTKLKHTPTASNSTQLMAAVAVAIFARWP